MPDSAPGPPTFFGNVVTSNINVDQLIIEIRSVILPHSQTLKSETGQEVVNMPAPTPDEIFSSEPIARVVLTFNAARFLRNFLDTAIPKIEATRKGGG